MSDADWARQLHDEFGADGDAVLGQARELAATLPDPARALADFWQFLAVGAAAAVRQFRADPLALDLLLRLGAISRYGFEVAARQSGDFWQIVQERQFRQAWGRQELDRALRAELAGANDGAARRAGMARFKHRQSLRLILGDLSGGLEFEAVVGELSALAVVLVQAALELAVERLAPRFGAPLAVAPGGNAKRGSFAVLAMGKLGAGELNYSSDLDLVFAYQTALDADGSDELHAYAQRLGRELIGLLENPDDGGRMYRIDMRLRPEGDRGELALSRRETADYYYSVGRPWERQALIKASAIAGDLALGHSLIDELRPWLFPVDPAWESLEEARGMRRRIEERAQEANLKTGAGGIRDIEFLAQFFQLCFGGRLPELRQGATLPVLRLLADRGILPKAHAAELERHYLWLRLVEHRLQMWEDRQEHELPAAEVERAALARRCGFAGDGALAAFDARHAKVRRRVRELVARHFLASGPEQDAMLALLVQGETDEALARACLGQVGFKDLAAARTNVRRLADEPFFVLSRSRTERSLTAIMPRLLDLFAHSPDPDQTLANFARIVEAVGGRATFFDLLAARPELLARFADLAGWSNFLVALLHDFPGLPDELIDTLNQAPRHAAVLATQARALIHGLEDPAEPLAFMLARETAAIAIRDLEGLDQDEVGRRLSDLAEAVVAAALGHVIAEQARAWGVPLEAGRPTRFAVLGLGKLGGRELTYASDMDVIFVCDPGGKCPRADHQGEEFWTRVAQALTRTLAEGRLYQIDARLRPWGEQGELVVDTTSLTRYWSEPRDLWERMAMLRVSHLAGDPRLGAEAVDLVRHAAIGRALPVDAVAQVRDMRRRLEESVAGQDHLKRGWGGYVDHEFIAQYLGLSGAVGGGAHAPGIADLLADLGKNGRIPAEAARELTAGLRLLRFVEARQRLAAGKAVSHLPVDIPNRTILARRCNFPDLAAFDRALHLARETGRKWFDKLVR
jgi:glutamate-ammonia-ligase adenylyltransferase